MEVGEVWPPQNVEVAAFLGMMMFVIVSSHYINALGDVFLFRKSLYICVGHSLC